MPAEVQMYIKTEHNLWHSGSETTFIEVYEQVANAEIQWEAERDSKQITSRGCPRTGPYRYEKLYEQFILGTFSCFVDWEN